VLFVLIVNFKGDFFIIGRNYWTKCEPILSKILTDLCVAFGDAYPPATQNERAGKNSFPQTPFLFARPLGLRPEKFFGERRNKKY
jgi:hypothetical protein